MELKVYKQCSVLERFKYNLQKQFSQSFVLGQLRGMRRQIKYNAL